MEIPPKAIWGLGGTIIGALATLGAAIFKYLSDDEDRDVERERIQADIEDSIREDLQTLIDLEREARKRAQQRAHEAEAEVHQEKKRRLAAEKEAEQYKGRVEDLEEKVEHLEGLKDTVEAVHRQYDRLAAKIEQDSDVDWDPHDV